MTAEGEQRMDRNVAAWIDEGPTRAPEELLAGVLERTRPMGQRPGWLARAGGAPSLDVVIGRRPWSNATWAAMLLALAAVGTAVAIAGSLLLPSRPIVTLPSTGPSAAPSAAATSTAPSAEPTPEPTDTLGTPDFYELVARPDLGFEVAYNPGAAYLEEAGPGLTFSVTRCHDMPICMPATRLSFESAPASTGLRYTLGDRTATINGSSIDELLASWEASFGTVRKDFPYYSAVQLDPTEPAVELHLDGTSVVLSRHQDRVFAITYSGLDAMWIDDHLPRFRFVDPSVALSGPTTDLASGISFTKPASWEIGVDDPDRTEITAEKGRGLSSGIFPGGIVSIVKITITRSTSPDGVQSRERVYAGQDAWRGHESFGRLGSTELILEQNAPRALLWYRGYVFEIRADIQPPNVFMPASKTWTDEEVLLRSFLGSASFDALDAEFTIPWQGLRFDLPSPWGPPSTKVGGGYVGLGVIGKSTIEFIDNPGAQLSGSVVSGAASPPGDPFEIVGEGTVTGSTLERLAGSIETVLGLSRSARRTISIAGGSGYAWSVPSQTFAGALVGVAIFEHQGRQYVFVEHDLFADTAHNGLGDIFGGMTVAP